ncbi:superoxide dismutase family protein [Streptomyces sp. NPDC049813]|uniref:superoxide dismutase family protein n=1 Tax=Streptomyces sp. NPDC049813 TaxID=3365597 RepID=UPI0037B16FA2
MVAGMVTGALAAAVLAAGGGGAGGTAESYAQSYWVRAAASFSPPMAFVASPALTYDLKLVPAAATVVVEQRGEGRNMTVSLDVEGLAPDHAYGAHVHQKPCGADPAAAGGHYQHVVDPERATAENEVWLDFTTDAAGVGTATVSKAWGVRDGEARSVVIHDAPGGAGKRVGCVTVPFASGGAPGAVTSPGVKASPGVETTPGTEVSPGATVAPGAEVSTGVEVSPGVGAAPGAETAPGVATAPVGEVAPGAGAAVGAKTSAGR